MNLNALQCYFANVNNTNPNKNLQTPHPDSTKQTRLKMIEQKTSNSIMDSSFKPSTASDASPENYSKTGRVLNHEAPSNYLVIDKGTAAETTVYVNRSTYDQILNAITFGTERWEEMGVDEDKRWVVVNGQRFECEHSPEEKALRKRVKMTLADYLTEQETSRPKKTQPSHVEALVHNEKVMALLGKIFNVSTPQEVLNRLNLANV